MRRSLPMRIAALALLFSSLAVAETSVDVKTFDGPKKKVIRDAVVQSLKDADIPVASAPKKKGKKKAQADEPVIVEGKTQLKKKGWAVTLKAHREGSSGEELALEAPTMPALLKKVNAQVPDFVRSQASSGDTQAAPAAEPEEKPEPAAEEKPEEKAEEQPEKAEPKEEKEPEKTAPAGEKPSPLTLDAGFRLYTRNFKYNQDVNRNLRPYKLGGAPGVAVAAAWYPAAHFTAGAAAHVGLVLGFEHGFAAKSKLDETGKEYTTNIMGYSAGLRVRLPLGDHELGVSARYGAQDFKIDGDRDETARTADGTPVVRDYTPDMAYRYIRPGLDARLSLGKVAVGAFLGYRVVTSAGAITEAAWFPAAKAQGLDAGLTLGYSLTPTLLVFIGGDIQRYGFDMHSKPQDKVGHDVAGGAVDQYLSGSLGVEWRPR